MILSPQAWKAVVAVVKEGLDRAGYTADAYVGFTPRDENGNGGVQLETARQMQQSVLLIWDALDDGDWKVVRQEFTILLAELRVLMQEAPEERKEALVPVYSAVLVSDGWARYIYREVK